MPDRQPIVIPADIDGPLAPIVIPPNFDDPEAPAGTVRISALIPVGRPGPAGPTGPPGTAFEVIAGADLSGHRAVRPQSDSTVVYATNTDIADAGRPLWLTLGAALSGDVVQVQSFGLIVEPSWSWVDGPIFLGIGGLLTQTPPVAPAGFLIQLAASDSPTSLFYNPRIPIAVE